MAKQFVVIDETGLTSWSSKTDEPESFDTIKKAQIRASELAKYSPGEPIGIYQLVITAIAPVGQVAIRRR